MTIRNDSLHAQRIRQQAIQRQQAEARRQQEAQQQAQRAQAEARRTQAQAQRMVDQRETRTQGLQLNWQRPAAPTPSRPPAPAMLQTGQALRGPVVTAQAETPRQADLQADFRNRLQFAQLAAPGAMYTRTSSTTPTSPSAPTFQAFGGTTPRAADGPDPMAGLTTQERRQVSEANRAFQSEVDDIQAIEDKGQRREAVLEASAALETQLTTIDPKLHEALLQEAGPGINTLTQEFAILNGDQTETFIGNLSRATEAVGPDLASGITDKVAANMPAVLGEHSDNKGEIRDGVRDAIKNGDGSVFAASLIESLQQQGQTDTANEIAKGTADGIQSVREDFDDKQEEVDKLNAELGQFVSEWNGIFTDEEMSNAIDAFRERHEETYGEWEDAGKKLATTFEGAGELVEREAALGPLDESGELLKQVGLSLENLPNASQIPDVKDLIAQGMEDNSSFITETASFLYDRAGDVNKARGQADNFAKAIFEVTASRAETLIKNQDLEGLEALLTDFQGAARGLGVAGVNHPEKLDELTDLVRTARQQTPPDFDAFSQDFANKAGELNGKVFADGSAAQNAFKSLGLVVSAGSLVNDLRGFSDAQIENKLQTIVDAVDLGADAYKLFKNPTAFKALGRATGGISAALGAVDAIRYAADGDLANAGLSAAGVVGSILMTTSAGGPVGTAIGAAISVGVVAGSFALDHHRSNQAEDRSEQNLEAFLLGAGLTEDQAYRLRDVTHKSHQSIGRIFSQIGEAEGIAPRTVLDNFLREIPHDQQDNVIDLIESLPRNDEGFYPDEAIATIKNLFQENNILP